MLVAGIKDEREFKIRKRLKKVVYFEANDLSENFSKNRQFAILAPTGTLLSILMHQNYLWEDNAKQMELHGFLVTLSKQGIHKEPSYQQDLLGYGSFAPFELTIEKREIDTYYVIMPYAKSEGARGYYDIIIYSDKELKVNQLQNWKYSVSIYDEWAIGKCGGRLSDDNSWLKNPNYLIKMMPEEDITEPLPVGILLSQAKSNFDMIPYSHVPYEFFIGLYVLDKDMFEIVTQCENWKNSQEVFLHFTAKKGEKEFIIVSTTQEPNQLTSFKLTVFSDVPWQMTPVEPKRKR
jgi:hypothetical protein